ncbi:MAG: SlyX family protein [Ghiorsea sp.]
MMDKRMIELETKSAYQEHMIQQLNEVIITQQQQIDAIETSMQQLREYLKSSHEQGQQEAAVDAPPPHY